MLQKIYVINLLVVAFCFAFMFGCAQKVDIEALNNLETEIKSMHNETSALKNRIYILENKLNNLSADIISHADDIDNITIKNNLDQGGL